VCGVGGGAGVGETVRGGVVTCSVQR